MGIPNPLREDLDAAVVLITQYFEDVLIECGHDLHI
jgi:hypothetical protein